MKLEITCIICPKGCVMKADVQDTGITVTGNSCPKGAVYAETECLHPVRTVTGTIRVANRADTMVSVKTETPVSKGRMSDVVKILRTVTAEAPTKVGDVLLQDVFGSRIIITKAVQ